MKRLPCVLVLAGLDPGGGAGLLADARAIAAAGAFACGVVTVQTTQSTRGLRRSEGVRPRLWVAQVRAVLGDQRVRALKVGALGDVANVRAAASLVRAHPRLPVVLDPVMLPTAGRARLLDQRALAALRAELIPWAALVTANAQEAAVLTGTEVATLDQARAAALAIVGMGARAALVKGGHLATPRATDVLAVGSRVTLLEGRRIALTRAVHGGGCVLASLIAGRLALGEGVLDAARWAKRVHARALARAADVGGPLTVLAL